MRRLPMLLLLMLVAAPLLADEPTPTERLAQLKQLGARITFNDQRQVIGVNLGERKVVDADLALLRGLEHLQELDLTRTRVTGTGLAHLQGLTSLRTLFLTDTKVDDAAISHLQGLKRLSLIGLSGTKISDAALGHLTGLTELKRLFCLGTTVSDTGAAKLRRELPQCEIIH